MEIFKYFSFQGDNGAKNPHNLKIKQTKICNVI